MPIHFHDPKNRFTYTTREADAEWLELISKHAAVAGRRAADIGCGGGIYTKALVRLGAVSVTGIDFSEAMLEGAEANCGQLANCRFLRGDASSVPLEDCSVDAVLERALIHHLTPDVLQEACREAYRILDASGVLIMQDRTPEDCLLAGSREHPRGYFFEAFPKLSAKETGRRHSSAAVTSALRQAGFHEVKELQLWEIRERHACFADYRTDLLNRTGRSILHELTDDELQVLANAIQQRTGYADEDPVVEKDRWTVWIACKTAAKH